MHSQIAGGNSFSLIRHPELLAQRSFLSERGWRTPFLLRLYTLLSPLHPFLYQAARETFCGNVVARDAGGLYFFFFFFLSFLPPFLYHIIYDINFAPVKAAPAGVVKRAEAFLSLPAISLSLEQGTAAAERRRERKGVRRETAWIAGPLPSTKRRRVEGRLAPLVFPVEKRNFCNDFSSPRLVLEPDCSWEGGERGRRGRRSGRGSLVSEDPGCRLREISRRAEKIPTKCRGIPLIASS